MGQSMAKRSASRINREWMVWHEMWLFFVKNSPRDPVALTLFAPGDEWVKYKNEPGMLLEFDKQNATIQFKRDKVVWTGPHVRVTSFQMRYCHLTYIDCGHPLAVYAPTEDLYAYASVSQVRFKRSNPHNCAKVDRQIAVYWRTCDLMKHEGLPVAIAERKAIDEMKALEKRANQPALAC